MGVQEWLTNDEGESHVPTAIGIAAGFAVDVAVSGLKYSGISAPIGIGIDVVAEYYQQSSDGDFDGLDQAEMIGSFGGNVVGTGLGTAVVVGTGILAAPTAVTIAAAVAIVSGTAAALSYGGSSLMAYAHNGFKGGVSYTTIIHPDGSVTRQTQSIVAEKWVDGERVPVLHTTTIGPNGTFSTTTLIDPEHIEETMERLNSTFDYSQSTGGVLTLREKALRPLPTGILDGQFYRDPNGDGDLSEAYWTDQFGRKIGDTNYRGRTPAQEEQASENLDKLMGFLGIGGDKSGSGPGSSSSGPSKPSGSNPSSNNSNSSGVKGDKKNVNLPSVSNNSDLEKLNTTSDKSKPIILDLDGTGIDITELSQSQMFVDASSDGLLNQIAWAGAGDGVLFYDADGDGQISETREFIFTEWDPTAASDLDALKSVFDTNGDGELSGAELADLRVIVANADGTFSAQTLTQLGITPIDLKAAAILLQAFVTGCMESSICRILIGSGRFLGILQTIVTDSVVRISCRRTVSIR